MAEKSKDRPQQLDLLVKDVDHEAPAPPTKKSDGNTTFLRAARSGNLEKVLEFINANVDINTSNSNGLNALHLASKDGHKEVVAELLKHGANVDAATKKGNTALHIASLAGQEEVVKLLVEKGASVNVQSQSGFTPLYMAAQENHERVVRYLLNNGANQSLATEDGFTPLAVAMQQGHDKVVTELLENDTKGKIRLPALHIAAKKDDCKAAALLLQSEHNNPDITSKSGFTPLHIASHYGNDAIASLLLAKGADVNYAAKHNITPLHVAAKWGRNNMVLLLLDKGASIVAKTRDGLTPLHCAARSGHEQVVDTLLQRHAPITAKTKNGLAPLHMASQGDHVDAARVLLQHRAPVDDVTVDYLTALHVASHCGHVSVAKLLLDRKADPNARALNGFTPLHIACKKNRVKVVELLLKHGASIEATTESGLSPLHVASFMGCMNIVIYLLQCEANPDVPTIRGETPLHLAARSGQTDIIRILLRNGAQVDTKAREQQTPLHIASRLGNQDIVMLLLQHGASVESVTKDLYTPLHIAAKEDQEEVAQVLLDNNASMISPTKKGFTPLHLASKYGRKKTTALLLQRGAPVDAQGKNGVTPLHVASHYDHQAIALLLLDKGASPHATAKNGHTPLHIAAKKNQMDIAAMLLEYGASAAVVSKAGFTPLHLSAQGGHVDMTNLLIEHKADVNHSSKNGLTPLHLCAQEDCVEVAKILVKNGADANAVTKIGYTPLHIASHFGQLNMVRFLLSQKVKVDCVTSTGYTPLHQAAQQGNSAIVAVLLDNGASPDSKNNQGQTALCIAQKLGYISVVEVLKNVTEAPKTPAIAGTTEEKYKVVAPETMQENFMSDSEDEGGDDATNEQSYRYLTIDEMKSLGDDSLPLDVTREDRYDTTAGIDESFSPQHTYNQLNAAPPAPDNVDVSRGPVVQSGFLVSFLVDAKGGAMRGCRHSGVRVIVPPQCVSMPTRVTCRYVRRDKPNHPPPPPLMEGEALASRILELGPVGVKFLGPVVIEVPNFAALRGNEREIVILRSDNGETWREHTVDSSNEIVHEILSRSFDKDGNQIQADEPGRITSIVTSDFPHYFAIVSRIRQEVHAIGPEGGMVSSSVVPQVQAVFPPGALTKKIKVGLQAQPIPSELTAAVLGNCVAVSPIVTIEPRRRKFHKPITLTLPVPQAANKGMINQYSGDAPTLRLLCSITGGTSRAQWEDVTGSTPLTFVKECVSFTTTVSARFWLMDIRDITMATKKATDLYREAIHIPFMAKFVVFAKRVDNNEARLRVFCMTDDKEDKTLESQEHFIEVAKSRDVEVLEGKKQLVELSGNLISVTKSGDLLKLSFNAFQENRLPFTVRVKDSHNDPIGRMLFFKEQKPVKMSTPHPPICVLNIVLPDGIVPDHDLLDSPMRKYSIPNDIQGYHRSELRFSDISNLIGEDWIPLSERLGITSAEATVVRSEYPESVPKQALTMLRIWHQQAGHKASINILESALLSIGREDIVQECILSTGDKSKRKPTENSVLPTKNVISEIMDDYRVGKHDVSSTDDDEKKYTAEEKVVLDNETKKSVSERKTDIEKRFQTEPAKRFSMEQRSDSVENRHQQSPGVADPAMKRQMSSSESKDVIKSSGIGDEKETFEPTTLTFEQKRLSFERGLSLDKGPTVLPDLSIKDGGSIDKFIHIEGGELLRSDVNSSSVPKEEKIVQIDKVNSKIEKPDNDQIGAGSSIKLSHQVEPSLGDKEVVKSSDDSFLENERQLSFAEKRLSFELGGDAKAPGSEPKSAADKVKVEQAANFAKAEGERRDSELFEGVSLGLEKLEAKPAVTEQSFLSPKPLKTPPPSPAEFKRQDSEDSKKNEAVPVITVKRKEVTDSNPKSSEISSADKRQHSYAEKDTPPVSPRDGVPKVDTDKRECTDYLSKKKFWQSFESTSAITATTATITTIGSESSKFVAPVPKPRASICTTSLTSDLSNITPSPPIVSRRLSESVSRISGPLLRTKDKVVSKSESEDNVLFGAAAADIAAARVKPSIKHIHSITTDIADSETEYIASCGSKKLAYENLAFSEEDENCEATADVSVLDSGGNVAAKKLFFEQQMHLGLEDPKDAAVPTVDIQIEKSQPVSHHVDEQHLDKSELESSEKKKQGSVDDVEDPSTATPIDMLLTNGCSNAGSVDSTRSESDFTPEELRSVSDLSVEVASESVELKKPDLDLSVDEGHGKSLSEALKDAKQVLKEVTPLLQFPSAVKEQSCMIGEKSETKDEGIVTDVTSKIQNIKPVIEIIDICKTSKSDTVSVVDKSKADSIHQTESVIKSDSTKQMKISKIPEVSEYKSEIQKLEKPVKKSVEKLNSQKSDSINIELIDSVEVKPTITTSKTESELVTTKKLDEKLMGDGKEGAVTRPILTKVTSSKESSSLKETSVIPTEKVSATNKTFSPEDKKKSIDCERQPITEKQESGSVHAKELLKNTIKGSLDDFKLKETTVSSVDILKEKILKPLDDEKIVSSKLDEDKNVEFSNATEISVEKLDLGKSKEKSLESASVPLIKQLQNFFGSNKPKEILVHSSSLKTILKEPVEKKIGDIQELTKEKEDLEHEKSSTTSKNSVSKLSSLEIVLEPSQDCKTVPAMSETAEEVNKNAATGFPVNLMTTIKETYTEEAPKEKTIVIKETKNTACSKIEEIPEVFAIATKQESGKELSKMPEEIIDSPQMLRGVGIAFHSEGKSPVAFLQTSEAVSCEDFKDISTTNIQMSAGVQKSGTILEKVITSKIPVSSVITTKRTTSESVPKTEMQKTTITQKSDSIEENDEASFGDAKSSKIPFASRETVEKPQLKEETCIPLDSVITGVNDFSESRISVTPQKTGEVGKGCIKSGIPFHSGATTTEVIMEKTPLTSSSKTVISTKAVGGVEDKSVCIEYLSTVDSKIYEFPSKESTKTTIITTQKSGGFEETQTIQEKVIFGPMTITDTPVTSVITTKRTIVDEFPVTESKETTIITTHSSGTTEKLYMNREKLTSADLVDSSIPKSGTVGSHTFETINVPTESYTSCVETNQKTTAPKKIEDDVISSYEIVEIEECKTFDKLKSTETLIQSEIISDEASLKDSIVKERSIYKSVEPVEKVEKMEKTVEKTIRSINKPVDPLVETKQAEIIIPECIQSINKAIDSVMIADQSDKISTEKVQPFRKSADSGVTVEPERIAAEKMIQSTRKYVDLMLETKSDEKCTQEPVQSISKVVDPVVITDQLEKTGLEKSELISKTEDSGVTVKHEERTVEKTVQSISKSVDSVVEIEPTEETLGESIQSVSKGAKPMVIIEQSDKASIEEVQFAVKPVDPDVTISQDEKIVVKQIQSTSKSIESVVETKPTEKTITKSIQSISRTADPVVTIDLLEKANTDKVIFIEKSVDPVATVKWEEKIAEKTVEYIRKNDDSVVEIKPTNETCTESNIPVVITDQTEETIIEKVELSKTVDPVVAVEQSEKTVEKIIPSTNKSVDPVVEAKSAEKNIVESIQSITKMVHPVEITNQLDNVGADKIQLIDKSIDPVVTVGQKEKTVQSPSKSVELKPTEIFLEKSIQSVSERVDPVVVTEKSEKSSIETIKLTGKAVGPLVMDKPAEKNTEEINQYFSQSIDPVVTIKQAEKTLSKIPKTTESVASVAVNPEFSAVREQKLSKVGVEKSPLIISCQEITKVIPVTLHKTVSPETSTTSASKIPKPGDFHKSVTKPEISTTSSVEKIKSLSSVENQKNLSKEIKPSPVKESRIPVRRIASKDKTDENIISPIATCKLESPVSEQLECMEVIAKNKIESTCEKVHDIVTDKSSDKMKKIETEVQLESKIDVSNGGKPVESYVPNQLELNVDSTVGDIQSTNFSDSILEKSKIDYFHDYHEASQSETSTQPKPKKVDAVSRDIVAGIKIQDGHHLSSSSVQEDELSYEADDVSDEQIVTHDYSDEHVSMSEVDAKVAAENLIDEIETELNQRPDLVENLLLSQINLLRQESNDFTADDSNEITDEDLRSTGTEIDVVLPECSEFFKKSDYLYDESPKQAEIKISKASPTEYEISYEQVEEFSVLESADFEEHIIPEESDTTKDNRMDSPFGLVNHLECTAAKPPIPEHTKKPSTSSPIPEIRRKSSEELPVPHTADILSPESGSSDTTTSRRYEDAFSGPCVVVVARTKKHHEIDPCSSSSESHYHSFTSRPCSSDVEGLLSLSAVPGSSEYETAASHDTSSYSHEFHTAVSSASIHESLKSIDSESSGHLASAEISSEISETLVPSSGELEHDIDLPGSSSMLFEETHRGIYSKTFLEPYDQEIPLNVIKGATLSQSHKEEQFRYLSDSIHDVLADDRLLSSCEDMSSLSTTDGGMNVQTVVGVTSTESDKMDNSLISEQNSLTMSAISNQLSTSSSDFKDEVESDRKTVDTNTPSTLYPAPTAPGSTASVTLLTSMSEEQGRHNVNTQVTSCVEPIAKVGSKSPDISPNSESFEFIEKPDLLDDFVIIEEVAKEAYEHDTEGISIPIIEKRKSSNFDDDALLPPPKTASTLTHVEYYEAGHSTAEDVCLFEQVTFEEKQASDKSYDCSPPDDSELYAREVEEGKRWIEMQFQADSEATAYDYGYERAPLEDIKEEDTDDMHSSKVGSVSSQISQSIGSLGSMKQSLSSTPDYDILAGKRYFSKPAEPDAISQGSLQEFERLEQLIALESMKGKLSSSQDSISSSSNEKKHSTAGDDISLSSLKEFEGLELVCGEVQKIEERAKAEEHCLSQIEEGHESQASESESCETLEKSCYDSDVDVEDYEKKMFEIDEIIRQAQSNVEKFADRLEKTESLGRGDSFEETCQIPDLDLDFPVSNAPTTTHHLSSELYSGKKYIENIDLSHSLTESTDSLELNKGSISGKYLDDQITSTDSLEGGVSSEGKSRIEITSDSLDNRGESPRSEATELLVHDEYDSSLASHLSPYQISSPDSVDATSSSDTHATYRNEMDSSIMSSSFTSADSNTMVSSSENVEHVVSNYSSWLEGGQTSSTTTTTTTTEVVESSGIRASDEVTSRVCSTRRTIEMPMEVEGVKVVCKGPQAKKMLQQEIASFRPGEYITETREVDAEGKVRVRRVIETRTVLTSEQVESSRATLMLGVSGSSSDGSVTGDAGGRSGSSSSSSKVTTTITHSDLTLAGPTSESSCEHEKKKDAPEDTSEDAKKKTK